jgi:hypothetical protein
VNKVRLRVVLVELVALSLLASALAVPALAEEEYQVVATLQSPEPNSSANFGYSVAVSGDIVVVGEYKGVIDGYCCPGKAYIFTTDGTLLASLQAPEHDRYLGKFGYDVAISGDIIVVGENSAIAEGKRFAGRAHIFDSNGNHIATLQAPEPDAEQGLGISVDIDGEIVIIGTNDETTEGIAFIFDPAGNHIATLQSPEPQIGSLFGRSVGVSEDIIVVGAPTVTVEGFELAGKVYVFDDKGNPIATLQAPEPQYNVYFGRGVVISGDIIVVDEPWHSVEGKDKAGRAHIYDSDGNHIATHQAQEPEATAEFGLSVDVSGDIIVVGEPKRNVDKPDEGRVHIFDSDGNLIATLYSPEPFPGGEFGFSVAKSEDVIVVGEPGAEVEGKGKAGRVYIFQAGAAAFTSSGLTIEPSSVDVGGTVTISVEVTNTGAKSGTHTVALMIDGEVEDEKTVTLNPDESETVSFQVSAAEQGSYSVEVDGLTGSYTVTETPENPSLRDRIPGFPYMAIILGLIAGVLVLWLLQRRH